MIIQPMSETETEALDFEAMLAELSASDLQEELQPALVKGEAPINLDDFFVTEMTEDQAIAQSAA